MRKDNVINWCLLGMAICLTVASVGVIVKDQFAMGVAVGVFALLILAVLQTKDKFSAQQKEIDELRKAQKDKDNS